MFFWYCKIPQYIHSCPSYPYSAHYQDKSDLIGPNLTGPTFIGLIIKHKSRKINTVGRRAQKTESKKQQSEGRGSFLRCGANVLRNSRQAKTVIGGTNRKKSVKGLDMFILRRYTDNRIVKCNDEESQGENSQKRSGVC